MDDTTKKFTINQLLEWGLHYEGLLKEPMPPGDKIDIGDRDVLFQYIVAANAALRQQCAQERKRAGKKPKQPGSTGGRPPGSGMGEQVMSLIATGVDPERALRAKARESGKPLDKVRRAHKYALKKVRQKTPR